MKKTERKIRNFFVELGKFQSHGKIESTRLFEFYAEKIIANAGSFALAIILLL